MARICGLLYLLIIALGMFGELAVRGVLVVGGDAAATAANIAANPLLWRAGIAGDLLMHVLDVPTIVIFYLLLRPVSHSLALVSTVFNIVQTSALALNKLALFMPLLVLDPAGPLGGFSPQQLAGVSYLAIQAHGVGFGIGLIFFGFTCVIRGWLIARSTYLPRWLGMLVLLAGVSYLINSFALILAPDIARALFPAILVPAFVGELCLALWLLVKGVDLPRWQQMTGTRAAGPSR